MRGRLLDGFCDLDGLPGAGDLVLPESGRGRGTSPLPLAVAWPGDINHRGVEDGPALSNKVGGTIYTCAYLRLVVAILSRPAAAMTTVPAVTGRVGGCPVGKACGPAKARRTSRCHWGSRAHSRAMWAAPIGRAALVPGTGIVTGPVIARSTEHLNCGCGAYPPNDVGLGLRREQDETLRLDVGSSRCCHYSRVVLGRFPGPRERTQAPSGKWAAEAMATPFGAEPPRIESRVSSKR